jgi:hypothetical protein
LTPIPPKKTPIKPSVTVGKDGKPTKYTTAHVTIPRTAAPPSPGQLRQLAMQKALERSEINKKSKLEQQRKKLIEAEKLKEESDFKTACELSKRDAIREQQAKRASEQSIQVRETAVASARHRQHSSDQLQRHQDQRSQPHYDLPQRFDQDQSYRNPHQQQTDHSHSNYTPARFSQGSSLNSQKQRFDGNHEPSSDRLQKSHSLGQNRPRDDSHSSSKPMSYNACKKETAAMPAGNLSIPSSVLPSFLNMRGFYPVIATNFKMSPFKLINISF